jgi:hypothetical protein
MSRRRNRRRSPGVASPEATEREKNGNRATRGGASGIHKPGAPPRVAASKEPSSERPPYPEDILRDPMVESLWREYWAPYVAAGRDPAQAPAGAVERFWKAVLPLAVNDPTVPQTMRQAWREASPRCTSERVAAEVALAARLEETWGSALALLDELIGAADLLLKFNEWRARLHASADPPEWTVRAQLVLLARAVQTAREVHVLLRSGYPAGALGRWRTLHEVSVVARFVDQCGDAVAEPYLYHDEMQALRLLQAYDRHSRTWSTHQGSKETKAAQEERVRALATRFGPLFKGDFGWATAGFPDREFNYPGPSFGDLEDAVGLSEVRPIYTKANHVVHASVRGFTDNPGHAQWPARQLLSGPSAYGLHEPGFWTARSLVTAAASSVGPWPLPSQALHLAAMVSLQNDAADAFSETWERLPSQFVATPDGPP